MADRGRDLKIAVISDVDKFDLSEPAQELDDLGRSAKDAADKIDKSASDIKQAGDDIKTFGKDADTTAQKVDGAFERIASSSRSNLRKVDDATHGAKKGLDDLKDEAHQSGREAAASFSGGFDDITGFIQETAANAFGGFGALGSAAGIAAAAGLGFIITKIQEINQKIDDTANSILGLKKAGQDNPLDKFKSFFDEMDAGQITSFKDGLDQAGISVSDFSVAVANGGPQLEEMRKRIQDAYDAAGPFKGELGHLLDQVTYYQRGVEKGSEGSKVYADGLKAATDATKEQTAATEDAAAALERHKQNVEATSGAIKSIATDTSDLTDKIQTEAQKQADATKTPKDSWTDYADTVKLSSKDIVETLDKQTKAAEDFRDNLLEVQKRGDEEFLTWVSQQPAAVAAAYADGTAKQKQAIYDAWRRNVGVAQGEGVVDGLDSKKPAATAKATEIHNAMADQLNKPITVPVEPKGPSPSEVDAVIARMQARATARAIEVPIKYRVVNPSLAKERFVP